MSIKFKKWGWEKKQRTMLRFIKSGDVICFKYDEKTYGFARIIAKVSMGHTIEILDYMSDTPEINEDQLENTKRMFDPIVLPSHSTIDRKRSGDWRIIGHQEDFVPKNIDNIYFEYTNGVTRELMNVLGESKPKENYIDGDRIYLYSPESDIEIKRRISALLKDNIYT